MSLDDVECEEEMKELIDYIDTFKWLMTRRYKEVKDFTEHGGLTPVVGDAASPPSVGEQTRTSGQAGEGSAPHPPRA